MTVRARKHTHPAAAPDQTRAQVAAVLAAARADLEAIVALIDDPDARDAMMGAIVAYVGAVVNADRFERPTRAASLPAALRAMNVTR